jgi:riboflavin synthase
MIKIGVADTTFARIDLGNAARRTLMESQEPLRVERCTVPGIKDLPVAAKKLIEEKGCALVVAIGMPGPESIDRQCAHEASLGIIQAQLLTNRHIIEVFVHEDEAKDDNELRKTALDRTRKHCLNALDLLFRPDALVKRAGTGRRQGRENAKPIDI